MHKKDTLILSAIFLVGFSFRMLFAAVMPFLGDECGTMMNICHPPSYILRHFHCWLTMNWYILLIKMIAEVFGEGFIAIRFLSVVAGAGSSVLTGLVARRLLPGRVWILAAALTAFNPYLVAFGAIARVYALYVFISLLLFLFFLRWRDNPHHGNSIGLSLTCLTLVLFNLNGVFILLWLLIVIAVELLRRRSDRTLRAGVRRLIIPGALCALAAGLFYAQLLGEIRRYSSEWVVAGVSSIDYIPNAASLYFAAQATAWILLALMLLGIYRTVRIDRYACAQLLLWIVVPIAAAALLGYSFNFWDFARFFIFIVPVIFMLSACGIAVVADFFPPKKRGIILSCAGLAFVVAWLPEINGQLSKGFKVPFHKAHAFIEAQAGVHDAIVCLDPFSRLHLSPYRACAERAMAEKAMATREVFLRSTVPDLLQDADKGKKFLVGTGRHVPHFHADTKTFGDIRVCILPPEPSPERYRRLLNGYEDAARALEQDTHPREDTDIFAIYSSLADLARIRGDAEKERYYRSFLEGA